MIVMFTARRLKPGAFENFRRAWDPGEQKPPGFQRAYHARNIRDEDEVISFGLFDMSIDDYRKWRGDADAEENQRRGSHQPSGEIMVDKCRELMLRSFMQHPGYRDSYDVTKKRDGNST